MNTDPYKSMRITMRQGGWRVQKTTEKGRPCQFVKTIDGKPYMVSSTKRDGSEWRITRANVMVDVYFASQVDVGAPRFATPMECAVYLELSK